MHATLRSSFRVGPARSLARGRGSRTTIQTTSAAGMDDVGRCLRDGYQTNNILV